MTKQLSSPTIDQVRHCSLWWNYPADGTKPYVLEFDIVDNDIIEIYGGEVYEFDAKEWSGEWSPCTPPTEVKQLTSGRLDGLMITPVVSKDPDQQFVHLTVDTLPGLRLIIEGAAIRELHVAFGAAIEVLDKD